MPRVERTFDEMKRDMQAEFAFPGEKFLFNVVSDPRDSRSRTLSDVIRRTKYEHPDESLRFDFDHLVVVVGEKVEVRGGRDFARNFCGIKNSDSAAVYAKPKTS